MNALNSKTRRAIGLRALKGLITAVGFAVATVASAQDSGTTQAPASAAPVAPMQAPPMWNLAHPSGYAMFMNPATYSQFMNPATYAQFMNPAFYMQFANPNNMMAWMNPNAYAPFMNPAMYMQFMNPQAYMPYMNPATYMQFMNPAAYQMYMNPATYMQWMQPQAYGMPAGAMPGGGYPVPSQGGAGAVPQNFFDPTYWMKAFDPAAGAKKESEDK